jgi:hypothetical protein
MHLSVVVSHSQVKSLWLFFILLNYKLFWFFLYIYFTIYLDIRYI